MLFSGLSKQVFGTVVVALGCMAIISATPSSTVSAAPNARMFADTKTITGTVTDPDGKPAANVPVRLTHKGGAEQGPAHKDPSKGPAGDISVGAPSAMPLQKGAGAGPAAAATTTDASGKFTFSNVQPGDYIIFAGTPKAAAKQDVKVEKDKDPAAVTIKLKKATT